MTEKNESKSSEPGRPAWAAGLLLSPDMTRASDRRLELTAGLKATMHPILRRLADAETRVTELTDLLAQAQRDYIARSFPTPAERGEPDFLIDKDGALWHHTEPGRYRYHKNKVLTDSRGWIDDNFGPVTEVWKDGAPQHLGAVTHFGADSFGLLPECGYDRTKSVHVAFVVEQVNCVSCLRKLASARGQERSEPDFLIDGMHDVWERVGADEYVCDFYDGGNLNRSQVEDRFKPTVAVWK